LGIASLAFAKSVENMEIGHNVSHGQWDWMNDPEIHSSTWEFDKVALCSQWKYAHNYRHHVFSNVGLPIAMSQPSSSEPGHCGWPCGRS
jgi:fatty acid desaturase